MFQTIEGRYGYVVDLFVVPKEPIEDGGDEKLAPYTKALNEAIQTGIVMEPGKYFIFIEDTGQTDWKVFAVEEEEEAPR